MSSSSDISLTAVITARGADSYVPDCEGAVDADIFSNGEKVGEVTLLPDPGDQNRLGPWGQGLDHWANYQLVSWILDQEDKSEVIDNIVNAVWLADDADKEN